VASSKKEPGPESDYQTKGRKRLLLQRIRDLAIKQVLFPRRDQRPGNATTGKSGQRVGTQGGVRRAEGTGNYTTDEHHYREGRGWV